jgi:hypothetical protein
VAETYAERVARDRRDALAAARLRVAASTPEPALDVPRCKRCGYLTTALGHFWACAPQPVRGSHGPR